MENTKKTILVPWDFTEVAEYALLHAIKVAKIVDNDITLLNILKKEKQVDETLKRLNIVAEEIKVKHGIKPHTLAIVGNIFETISEVATEVNSNLVIMGTHGIKGMQKLTGSWALKVIVGSVVPFVIVQAPPKDHVFTRIVVPMDHRKEVKEKLAWVNYLHKFYNSEIHLFRTGTSDQLLLRKANNNLLYAKKYFLEKNLDYKLASAEGKKSFSEETLNYSKEIDADMIMIMTTKDIGIQDYMLGASEQEIIANDSKIPTMCVNPREDLRKYGSFS